MRGSGTIVALATGRGGAIAIVRVSGPDSIALVDGVFVARSGLPLARAQGYTVHFGEIRDHGEETGGAVAGDGSKGSSKGGAEAAGEIVDEVLVTVFRAPHSYTGEDSVEISCHASPYVTGRIMRLLVRDGMQSHAGVSRVRMAAPGEFTVRAFLAGKLDLSQAEAVADLVASSSRAGHLLAMNQLRGGVSSTLASLRSELTGLAALVELELDFSEEQVEFASREHLCKLARGIAGEIDRLVATFTLGNAVREGIPVAIVGRPNVGKSTLLNALAGDDRAMTSEIAGTTRDRIEERVVVDGVDFRFIDTAGLRDTDDVLERMGIDRALAAVAQALVILLVVDGADVSPGGEEAFGADVSSQIADLDLRPDQRLCVVVNKADKMRVSPVPGAVTHVSLSALTGEGLGELRSWLSTAVDMSVLDSGSAVISGARHYEALICAREAIGRVLAGLGICVADGGHAAGGTGGDCGAVAEAVPVDMFAHAVPVDMFAQDLREALYHLGTITGAVTTDEILNTIFSKFCIGK